MAVVRYFGNRAAFGVVWLVMLSFPVDAGAQTVPGSFEELQTRAKIGDMVYVVDGSGQETKGRIATLSAASLTLALDGNRRDFLPGAVTRVDRRRRDSIRNGLLIGLGSGAALGFLVGRTTDSPSCRLVPRPPIECGQGALIGTVGGAFWGGVAGWITDALIRTREVVYFAPLQRHLQADTRFWRRSP